MSNSSSPHHGTERLPSLAASPHSKARPKSRGSVSFLTNDAPTASASSPSSKRKESTSSQRAPDSRSSSTEPPHTTPSFKRSPGSARLTPPTTSLERCASPLSASGSRRKSQGSTSSAGPSSPLAEATPTHSHSHHHTKPQPQPQPLFEDVGDISPSMKVSARNTFEETLRINNERRRLQLEEQQRKKEEFELREARRNEASQRLANRDNKALQEAYHRQVQWAEMVYLGIAGHAFHLMAMDMKRKSILTGVFRQMLIRVMRVWAVRKRQQKLTAERFEALRKPTKHDLLKMPLFADWNDDQLWTIIEALKPRSYTDGEFLMHDGDAALEFFILAKGKVSVLVRSRDHAAIPLHKRKSRAKHYSVIVAEKTEGMTCGEYAMLAKDIRSASVISEGDTDVWTLRRAGLMKVVDSLPKDLHHKLYANAQEYRKQNLVKSLPLRVEQLRKIRVFANWNGDAMQELLNAAQALVLEEGEIVASQGDNNTALYIIVDGSVQLTVNKAGTVSDSRTLKSGDTFGEAELLCGERRTSTSVCLTQCEVWRIRREAILSIGITNAAAVLDAKRILNTDRAAKMKKPTASHAPYFSKDPIIVHCLGAELLAAAWALAVPMAFSANDTVVQDSEEATKLYFIVNGSYTVRYGKDGPPLDTSLGSSVSGQISPMSASENFDASYRSLSLSTSTVVQKETFVVGVAEMALRRQTYMCNVRCKTSCEAWVMERSAVEQLVVQHGANVLKELGQEDVAKAMYDLYKKGEFGRISDVVAATLKQKSPSPGKRLASLAGSSSLVASPSHSGSPSQRRTAASPTKGAAPTASSPYTLPRPRTGAGGKPIK